MIDIWSRRETQRRLQSVYKRLNMPIRIQSSFQHVCIIRLISKGSRLYSVDPFCSLTQAGRVIKIKSRNIWDQYTHMYLLSKQSIMKYTFKHAYNYRSERMLSRRVGHSKDSKLRLLFYIFGVCLHQESIVIFQISIYLA